MHNKPQTRKDNKQKPKNKHKPTTHKPRPTTQKHKNKKVNTATSG